MSFEIIIHITIDIVITGVILFYLRLGVKRVEKICKNFNHVKITNH